MLDRRLQAHAQVQQMLDLRAHPAPLFPVAHADVEVMIPRDREARFNPVLIGKYQRRLPDFDDKVTSWQRSSIG